MDEFLKLNWRINDVRELEHQTTFLSEETICDSYVYKSFVKPLTSATKKKKKQKKKKKLSKGRYVPGKECHQMLLQRSLLTKGQKQHCLQALKLLQSGKNPSQMTTSEKYSYKVYTVCQPKLVEENNKFLEYIQQLWNKNIGKFSQIGSTVVKYAQFHWREKCRRYFDYPKFYKELFLISQIYDENEGAVQYNCEVNLLETGSLARFSMPNLKEVCLLKLVTLPKVENSINSKLPVSQDQNLRKLIENHAIDAVISSSGIHQIIDNTDPKSRWTLPVVIKEFSYGNGDKPNIKKVVFIDKPLPKIQPNYTDLKHFTYKRLLKTNFCQYEAFSFPNGEVPLEEEAISPKLVPRFVSKKNEAKMKNIHHNVSYRIWKIKKIDHSNELMKSKTKDTELNLLVRCKLDACEMTEQGILQPTIVKPKIEQQLQYGANIASKSELAREWASLFFRPFSTLFRARIYSRKSEVISVEKCSLQKINSEASTNYGYRPVLGLGVLQKFLHQLIQLKSGNYILQHLPRHGTFVAILKECDEDTPRAYDLHAEFDECDVNIKEAPKWLPIDVNYILPVHELHNKPPATFDGWDKATTTKIKKGNKKKKKQQGPEKKDEQTAQLL